MKRIFWICAMCSVIMGALAFGVAPNWSVRAAIVCVGWHFIDKYW
jgi:hypothetical protein